MTTRADKIAAVDVFMASAKRIVRPDAQEDWRPGHDKDELIQKWPIEIAGEQLQDANLAIIGNPRRGSLFFRILILFPGAICRLDHTDETHGNPLGTASAPTLVRGPHYHSWPLNRKYLKDFSRPMDLPVAISYPGSGQSFDNVLRWFCDDTNIEPLPTNHRIELPILRQLL